ncbi:Lysophospholipase L1 [Thalassobacillus cyri]|uniref:Lysophospholipase L1 n=1 Tax=Thalassobacillus cyri TaxID=571932 RepID=A0A1H3Y606_9BACI|nr:SGNH/GDSL hydrolase family protein [Thalassobacillus cyri]SEA07087.1 Lysophospholipase L1 [Thalassobacillus cyri]
MKNKTFFLIITAIILVTGLFIIAISQEQPATNNDTDQTNQEQADDTTESEKREETPEYDDASEKEDKTLGEDIKESFTDALENAVGLFLKKDLKIVAIGDSLTQGVGDGTEKGGYVGILEENLRNEELNPNLRIENYGKRGNRTDQLIKRMQKEEISTSLEDADIVLITIGANDVMKVIKDNFQNLDYQDFVEVQDQYKQNLEEIFQMILEKNQDASIYHLGLFNPFEGYFTNIPEMGQIMSDWNQIGIEVSEDYDAVTFIPIEDLFTNPEETLLWEDHFHPNKKGYKLIAERVLEYIRPDIEQNQ